MKRTHWIGILVIAAVAVGFVGYGVAGEGDDHGMKAKEITVEGLLVDTKCYGMNPVNWKTTHMTPKGEMPNCAQACAKMGIPVGVLKDGKEGGLVYILVTPSGALADHMARTVKVTGMHAYEGGIIPEQVWVKNDEGKWEEVKIATMM